MTVCKHIVGALAAAVLAGTLAVAPAVAAAQESSLVALGFSATSLEASFVTVVQDEVVYRAPAHLSALDRSQNGVSIIYHTSADGLQMLECSIQDGSFVGSEDEFTATYLDQLATQIPNADFDPAVIDVYVDDVLVRHVAYTTTVNGNPFGGMVSLVFGDTYTAAMTSAFMTDDPDTVDTYVIAHLSLGPNMLACGAPLAPAEPAGQPAPAPAEEPAAAPQPAVEPEPAPAEPATPLEGTFTFGESANVAGWDIALGAYAETVPVPQGFYLEDLAGATLLRVPVQITNATGEVDGPDGLLVRNYLPGGERYEDWPGIGMTDSLENALVMRNGATQTVYLYTLYVGAGEYSFEIVGYIGDDRYCHTAVVTAS